MSANIIYCILAATRLNLPEPYYHSIYILFAGGKGATYIAYSEAFEKKVSYGSLKGMLSLKIWFHKRYKFLLLSHREYHFLKLSHKMYASSKMVRQRVCFLEQMVTQKVCLNEKNAFLLRILTNLCIRM